MKSFARNFFLIVITIILFSACSKKKAAIPGDVMPMKQMVEVMTDIHLAEAAKDVTAFGDKPTNSIEEYYAFIFKKYQITQEQYQKSFNFYKAHPELMEEIYAEVISRLSEMQAKPGNH